MAINKKGSRKISVDEHDFRWRATGNDDWISIVVWSSENENARVIATVGYHNDMQLSEDGGYSSKSQLLVTNRVIRELILYVGAEKLVNNQGQINIGRIEDFYNVSDALRS